VKIIPVSINHDFVFEQEFLTAKDGSIDANVSLKDIISKIYSVRKEKLGRCIVKFLKPIDIN